MLNINKIYFNLNKLCLKKFSENVYENLDKPKIFKKKKLIFYREGMIAGFQLLRKSEAPSIKSLFHDGYVFFELKEADTKFVL